MKNQVKGFSQFIQESSDDWSPRDARIQDYYRTGRKSEGDHGDWPRHVVNFYKSLTPEEQQQFMDWADSNRAGLEQKRKVHRRQDMKPAEIDRLLGYLRDWPAPTEVRDRLDSWRAGEIGTDELLDGLVAAGQITPHSRKNLQQMLSRF